MNPYAITGPALISFSGGRTSAFMLRQILDAHNGKLPSDVHVTFANTGKERKETLDFVKECSERWSVPVSWLEYKFVPPDNSLPPPEVKAAVDAMTKILGDEYEVAEPVQQGKHSWAIVNYETASRDGEPFAELIRARKYLPNPVTRFCTSELKIRVMKKFVIAQGYEEWDVVLGLRADEPRRCQRAALSSAKERFRNLTPMERAGHTLKDVMDFWAVQPFDLKLRQDEGNCDLCFLKGLGKLLPLISERPESAKWWSDQEIATGATFRKDGRGYANLLKIVQDDELQGRMFDEPEMTVCNCTD